MNIDKEKEKILQKAVQLITSEISIKIHTHKIFIKQVTISPKMDSETLCDILGYFTSSELKQEGIAQVTIKL